MLWTCVQFLTFWAFVSIGALAPDLQILLIFNTSHLISTYKLGTNIYYLWEPNSVVLCVNVQPPVHAVLRTMYSTNGSLHEGVRFLECVMLM